MLIVISCNVWINTSFRTPGVHYFDQYLSAGLALCINALSVVMFSPEHIQEIMIMRKTDSLIGNELLIAVFTNFPKDEPLRFRSEEFVMKAFYEMSDRKEYADLFENYSFDIDGAYPNSIGIKDGIAMLWRAHLLNTEGPMHSYYYLSKGIDFRFKKVSLKLNEEQKKRVIALADELQKKLLSH